MEIHGYTENGFIDATIDGFRMIVPDNMANRHRQRIAEWEAEGNIIPDYVPPVQVPGPYWLYKSTFIRRMTVTEATILEMGLTASNAWMRMLYNSVEYFVSDDALFQALNQELAMAIGQMLNDPIAGQERADYLTSAPSVEESSLLTPEVM